MSNNLDLLKQLRDITGAGILDCKKYLNKVNNNLDDAVKLMRSEEGIKADKKSSRIAAEGIISFHSSNKKFLLIEINSETDFVARSKDFLSFVNEVSSLIIESPYNNLDEFMQSKDEGLIRSMEEIRKKAITKLGENICIRRYILKDKPNNYVVGYTHNNKIGAMIVLKDNDEQLGKDICMQIVASNPLGLNKESLDKDILTNEKEIYKAELDKINKKDDIKRNILDGKIKKFITENTLLSQPFIKDNTTTLKKIIKNNEILEFFRYQLGEGIEKKEEDFAKEVYSQIK
jgi:elongation factor Ts